MTDAQIYEMYPQEPDEWRGVSRRQRELRTKVLERSSEECPLCPGGGEQP